MKAQWKSDQNNRDGLRSLYRPDEDKRSDAFADLCGVTHVPYQGDRGWYRVVDGRLLFNMEDKMNILQVMRSAP